MKVKSQTFVSLQDSKQTRLSTFSSSPSPFLAPLPLLLQLLLHRLPLLFALRRLGPRRSRRNSGVSGHRSRGGRLAAAGIDSTRRDEARQVLDRERRWRSSCWDIMVQLPTFFAMEASSPSRRSSRKTEREFALPAARCVSTGRRVAGGIRWRLLL